MVLVLLLFPREATRSRRTVMIMITKQWSASSHPSLSRCTIRSQFPPLLRRPQRDVESARWQTSRAETRNVFVAVCVCGVWRCRSQFSLVSLVSCCSLLLATRFKVLVAFSIAFRERCLFFVFRFCQCFSLFVFRFSHFSWIMDNR